MVTNYEMERQKTTIYSISFVVQDEIEITELKFLRLLINLKVKE